MQSIFISYRRGESIAAAGRIRDRLVQKYGRHRVFVDVEDIRHGEDFVKVLRERLGKCGVVLAVIGPHWVSARDDKGNRQLDNKDDFVATELTTALENPDIKVIPVLIDG